MIDMKSPSLADRVFERLEEDILSGKYKRGEILTEMMLVSDMGVSRTPIRESLRRLEQEHLIEIMPKGIMVVGVTEQDLSDVFDIRIRIEGMICARVAEIITDEQLATLREALELQEFYVNKNDVDHIKKQDSKFHELIYKFANSTIYYDTLKPLHIKVQKFRRFAVENHDRALSSVHEHRAIFEAIERHDAKGAEEAMARHIQNASNYMVKKENS